jgi:hypothetical protein
LTNSHLATDAMSTIFISHTEGKAASEIERGVAILPRLASRESSFPT